MMIFVIIIHSAVCLALIGLVLIQRGRGGGLVESFQGVESMFGTKTDVFLTRLTTVLSILFFLTCLTLAFMSVKQSRSLMQGVKPKEVTQVTKDAAAPAASTQAPAAPSTAEANTGAKEAEKSK